MSRSPHTEVAKRRWCWSARLGLVLVGLALAPGLVRAVQVETILAVDMCAACGIRVVPGPVWRGEWVEGAGDVDRTDDGRFTYVPSNFADHFMIVAEAEELPQRVGRSGEGPGEYGYIRFVRPHDGRFHVFDAMLRRRTVLDADLGVVRITNMPVGQLWGVEVLRDSSYVVNARLDFSHEPVKNALHLFGQDGELIRSFDPRPVDNSVVLGRAFAEARDGQLWAAHRKEYRIDLWSLETGELVKALVRKADWFPVDFEGAGRGPRRDAPPSPSVLDIEQDADGRLWVMIRVATDRWTDAFEKTPEDAHPEYGEYRLADVHVGYDTVVEVIDPTVGAVLATTTVDQALAFLRRGIASSLHEPADGWPARRFWQLQLVQDSPSQHSNKGEK